jgi:hypothetical protein
LNVWITPLDGQLPNIALMKLAHWHIAKGDSVSLRREINRDLWDKEPDIHYASSIFKFSQERQMRFGMHWPKAIIGGTGTPFTHTVEQILGVEEYEYYDYSAFPEFLASIGFSQRGCRLKCKFCVVPGKEGKPRSVNRISEIWRGEPYPKHLHLLDNDFFGQPEWRDRVEEIREGQFKVCLSQGINVRLIHEEGANALATLDYRDNDFSHRRLYTAWDNLKDESVFFNGVDTLEAAGIPPTHLMAYMLIGFDKNETWDRIWHRFTKMVERGISPYPMVFNRARKDLLCFQRWVLNMGGMYRWISWGDYERGTKSAESLEAWRPFADRLLAALPRLQKEAA